MAMPRSEPVTAGSPGSPRLIWVAGIFMFAYVDLEFVSSACWAVFIGDGRVFTVFTSDPPLLLVSYPLAIIGGVLALIPQRRLAPWVMVATLLVALTDQFLEFDPEFVSGGQRLLLTIPGVGLIYSLWQVHGWLVSPDAD